jgi:hypothetical protein
MALLLAFAGLVACVPGGENEAREAEEVPIGPGSDSTALRPPDTPVSRLQPVAPGTTAADTTR